MCPPTFTFSFLTFKKLACRRRDRVRGLMISGFIFRVRCGFLHEVCVRRVVSRQSTGIPMKGNEAYRRNRSPTIPSRIVYAWKVQTGSARTLIKISMQIRLHIMHPFIIPLEAMTRNLPLSLKSDIITTIHNSVLVSGCAIIKRNVSRQKWNTVMIITYFLSLHVFTYPI